MLRGTSRGLNSRASFFFFCLALVIYLSSQVIKLSMLVGFYPADAVNRVCLALSIVFLFLAEYLEGTFTRADLIAILSFCAISFAALVSENRELIVVAAFILVARHFEFGAIAQIAACTIAVCCTVVIAAAMLGITLDYTWIQGGRVRHGLGFRYATYLSHFVLYFTMLVCYVKKGRIDAGVTLAIVLIDVMVFLMTGSRNSFVLTLVVLAVSGLFRRWLDLRVSYKGGAYVWAALFPVIAFASVALMVLYDPSVNLLASLNSALGGRLSISHHTYELYGITVFGQHIEWVGNGVGFDMVPETKTQGTTFVDNSYCNCLLQYGAVTLILFLAAFSLLMFKAALEGDRLTLFLLSVIAIHSFIDPWWIALRFDVFVLLIGTNLLGKTWAKKAVGKRNGLTAHALSQPHDLNDSGLISNQAGAGLT